MVLKRKGTGCSQTPLNVLLLLVLHPFQWWSISLMSNWVEIMSRPCWPTKMFPFKHTHTSTHRASKLWVNTFKKPTLRCHSYLILPSNLNPSSPTHTLRKTPGWPLILHLTPDTHRQTVRANSFPFSHSIIFFFLTPHVIPPTPSLNLSLYLTPKCHNTWLPVRRKKT